MEETAIKLLYINSKVHALININQSPAGETGMAAVTQPIAANSSFFVSMLPLENDSHFVYLPFTRRVSTAAKGALFDNDGLIELCMWPDNIIELTLHPAAVYRSDEAELKPAVLSPFDFYTGSEKHTAFVYNEAGSSFIVEHGATGRLKFIAPLPFLAASADIAFVRLGELPVLYAAGKTTEGAQFFYAANVLPDFSTAVCTVCAAYSVEKSSLSVVTEGEFWQVRTQYVERGGRLSPENAELGWYTCEARAPATVPELCACALQAVRANRRDAAMSCLTPSLAEDLGFNDLKEFFGDFISFTPTISPACGQSSIALKYAVGRHLFAAREFCVDTKTVNGTLLIDNIREP
jgi:hypothetical protein